MLTLRPYQEEVKAAVYGHLRSRDDNPCAVVPTAGGKTPIAAYLEAIHQAHSFDRAEVRCRAAEQFASGRIVDLLMAELEQLRGVAAAAEPA